jgi:hypothetical protein
MATGRPAKTCRIRKVLKLGPYVAGDRTTHHFVRLPHRQQPASVDSTVFKHDRDTIELPQAGKITPFPTPPTKADKRRSDTRK